MVISSPSFTQNANQIATVKMDSQATIWTSDSNDLHHWQSTLAELQDSATLAWLNSDDLLVNSRRTGYPNLAILHTRTGTETPLTNEPFMEQHGSPIPGTSSVLFSSNRSGGFHIWRFNPQMQQMKQLTFGESYDDTPVASPDGRFFVYTSWLSNAPAIYRLPVGGGTPLRLISSAAKEPQISPDGNAVACRIETGAGSRSIAVLPISQATAPRIIAKAHLPFKWAPAGDALISSITDAGGISNLWRIPLDGSPSPTSDRLRQPKHPGFFLVSRRYPRRYAPPCPKLRCGPSGATSRSIMAVQLLKRWRKRRPNDV